MAALEGKSLVVRFGWHDALLDPSFIPEIGEFRKIIEKLFEREDSSQGMK